MKIQQKTSKWLPESHRELLGASTVVWSTFEFLESHTKFNISAHKNGRKLVVFGAKILILRFFIEIMWKEFKSHRTRDLGGRRLYEFLAR